MRSASESIAQLASALAKAQIELVNPAKTLTGMIDRWGTGNEGQTYRYASLSAGLEIVRKSLCKHELAVIQTTHVDRDSAMVHLTTTLAHGSGEWICATWPVCRTADMTNPKLMGAALTYARRYGLFTLVGIAGEDDLDAPELPETELGSTSTDSHGGKPNGALSCSREAVAAHNEPLTADSTSPTFMDEAVTIADQDGRAEQGSDGALSLGRAPSFIEEDASCGSLRKYPRGRQTTARGPRHRLRRMFSDNPLRDLHDIKDPDELFRWAVGVLPLRNKLPDAAREALDAAFLAKAEVLRLEPDLLPPNVRASPASPPLPTLSG